MGGDGKHRNLVAVRIEEPVDQVQVAGAAAAGADRELAGQFGVGGGGERCGFLVAHVHPLDLAATPDRVGDWVQTVADDAIDTPHTSLDQNLHQIFRNVDHSAKITDGITVSDKDKAWPDLALEPAR